MDKNCIKNWIENHSGAFLDDAMELIRVRSVSEKGAEGYPFGKGCAAVLDKALAISAAKGMETENHAYYCGSALLRGKTEREIGIFTHLDVVHEGPDWQSDPYQPYTRDGWLFGRGSADNKAPAMCALYAMHFLREQGVALDHTIRLFFGCDEENNMEDIAYFTANFAPPDRSFVPDASFPVCYAEKGILEAELSTPLRGNLCGFSAGTAANAVPAHAAAVLNGVSLDEVRRFFAEQPEFAVAETSAGIAISVQGIAAHAAFPEGSASAAVKLAWSLCRAPFLQTAAMTGLRFIGEVFADYYGEAMGVARSDELSGKLTVIGGRVYVKENRLVQTINLRYPVSADSRELIDRIFACGSQYGWNVESIHDNPPYCLHPQSEFVVRLNDICREVLQEEMEPYSMGGGTYARKLPNAVGYGPGIRGQAKPCPPGHGGAHQPDECVRLDNLFKAIEIYSRAIMELDRL